MGVVRTSVGRTLNVKPVLSFTRFKGLVTARNHAARVTRFPSLRNPLKCPLLSIPDLTYALQSPQLPRIRNDPFITSLHFHESRYGNETPIRIVIFLVAFL